MSRGQTGFVPGTKWVCPRDKPRFSPYFTQWKPSLSLGQTQFVPGTKRGRRAAERVYVLKVYVPFSFPIKINGKDKIMNQIPVELRSCLPGTEPISGLRPEMGEQKKIGNNRFRPPPENREKLPER